MECSEDKICYQPTACNIRQEGENFCNKLNQEGGGAKLGGEKQTTMSNTVTINIAGRKFVTFLSTLTNIPNSKLSAICAADSSYDSHNGEFFFDRNPELFPYILDCYQSGDLHFPHSFCGPVIKRELEFWNIPESRIAPCCWKSYKEYEEEDKTLSILEKTFGWQRSDLFSRSKDTEVIRHGWMKWRKDIWMFLEDPASSCYAKIWTYFFIFLLVLSVAIVCAETLPVFRVPLLPLDQMVEVNTTNPKLLLFLTTRPHPVLCGVEYTCAFIFSLELLLKFIVWPQKKSFFTSFFNIIDILSVVPMAINVSLELHNPSFWTERDFLFAYSVISLASVFRAIRILKLVKHNRGLQIIYLAVRSSAREISLLLLLMLIGTLIFSTMMFFAEFNEEDTFLSIPMGFWWSIVTMTTVGYGDKYPKSPMGYLVGSLCAVAGMLATAMPIPVIANSFHLYYTYARIRRKLNEVKLSESTTSQIIT